MIINWQDIKAFNNSQNNAFEELVGQLAREEEIPNKKIFYRIAAPDGGVECYCVLDNGEEYGWQAKFFSSMGASQWSQLKESFETALKKHPNLTKYYICIPLDRQDPRREDQSWLMDKWNQKTKEWTEYAKSKGRRITFEYWGSFELIHRLSQEKHAGRRLFWFSQEEFSNEWFRSLIESSIKNLGHRYTPKLNVELNISKYFDAICQNNFFRKNVKERVHNFLIITNKAVSSLSGVESLQKEVKVISTELDKLKKQFDIYKNSEMNNIDIDNIHKSCELISSIFSECEEILRDDKKNNGVSEDTIRHHKYLINNANNALYDISDFNHGPTLPLANQPVMLITGKAGIGKSHLLADIASKKIKSRQFCVFLLGQHFTSEESPWTQILNNLLRLKCNEKELLGALNAKGEACNERLLFIIDAINEGKGRYFWPDHINGFINDFSKYPYLGLVLSVRSSYEKLLVPETLMRNNLSIKVNHLGFNNIEYQASSFFFSQYGIEQPSVPLLNPEFSNPLFLKLFCEGLHRADLSRIPKGYAGISSIMNFFLESVDRKLSYPTLFDYPFDRHIIRQVINCLIKYKIENNSNFIPYDEANEIADRVLSKHSNKRLLLDALISEGVLSKNLYWTNDDEYEEGIYIAYERFDDYLTAQFLLEKYLDEEKPEELFKNDGSLAQYIDRNYYRQGILEAFSILLPERVDKELYELLDNKKMKYQTVIKAFIHSLIWRKPDTIKEKVKEYINQNVFRYDYSFNQFFQMVYSVAADPEHLFNSNSLHRYLMQFSMADRDSIWTTYLHDKNYEGSAMQRLIDWALLDKEKNYLSDESRLLAGKALAWLFTSTNLLLRDSATRALAVLFENNISLISMLLDDFQEVNDPYVYERIFAAAYGAVLNSNKLKGVDVLSQKILEILFNEEEVYPNILVRDYGRNIIEYAMYKNLFQMENPEIISPPYKSKFPASFPTNDEIDKYKFDYKAKDFKDYNWGQNSIIDSMITEYGRGIGGYGDFGRYTFQRKLHNWDSFNPQELSNYACMLIFEQYGYDGEKHGEFDKHATQGDRYRNKVERIGKKYQWIALYEVLARISDNHKMTEVSSRWGDEKSYIWYKGPWEPFVRNIDPSSNNHLNLHSSNTEPPIWEIITYNDWQGTYEDWIISEYKLPDPINIIHVCDNINTQWLTLEKHIDWDEPIPTGQDKYEYPHKSLWYQIKSYFVKSDQVDKIISWAKEKNLLEDIFFSGNEQYQIFAREYYWSPAYRFFDNPYFGRDKWYKLQETNNLNELIGEIISTTERYNWESGGDYLNQPSYFVPREFMYVEMKLQPSKNIGEWLNNQGEVVCFDPAAKHGENSCLMVRKDSLLKFLKDHNLSILWNCQGQKQIYGNFNRNIKISKWLELSGIYTLADNEVVGSIKPIIQGR